MNDQLYHTSLVGHFKFSEFISTSNWRWWLLLRFQQLIKGVAYRNKRKTKFGKLLLKHTAHVSPPHKLQNWTKVPRSSRVNSVYWSTRPVVIISLISMSSVPFFEICRKNLNKILNVLIMFAIYRRSCGTGWEDHYCTSLRWKGVLLLLLLITLPFPCRKSNGDLGDILLLL